MGAQVAIKKEKDSVLRTLIALAIPTVLEEILSTLLQYVDTAMVGQLGEEATAAVSVTTTISWLVHALPGAFCVALVALIARKVGEKDAAGVQKLAMQAVHLALILGIVLGGISMALSPFIPKWMGAEEGIRAQSSMYFFIISAPMVFRMAALMLGAALRAVKDTKTPMRVNLSANLLNVGLNYLLIYVVGLGVNGAAISTAVSYTVNGILMWHFFRANTALHFPLSALTFDKRMQKEIGKIALPAMGTTVASCLGYVLFAREVSGMGTTIFAAHSIAVNAETLFYIPGYGLRTATQTIVGISLGERDEKKFKEVCKFSIGLTLLMMCLTGLMLYFTAGPIMKVFTSSDRVAALGASMLMLVAFSEPFFGLMVVMEGIFYGLGRTGYVFRVETFSMYVVRILSTFIVVEYLGLGLREVWYCMIADNICKAILLLLPMLSKKKRRNLIPSKE